MRVKWNRHLDGTGVARRCSQDEQEPHLSPDTSGTAKKPTSVSSKSSSPGFLKFFRIKKHPKKEDDASTTTNETSPPTETFENEDCVSLNSVATTASQPGASVDYFPARDRSVSLFSSFRINFPGGSRKKKARRIVAQSNFEESVNEQNGSRNYSTPDLRKPITKSLESTNVTTLSTSSPSVRNEFSLPVVVDSAVSIGEAFQSLDELPANHAESLEKLRTPARGDSRIKLTKSVSFSDCQVDEKQKHSAVSDRNCGDNKSSSDVSKTFDSDRNLESISKFPCVSVSPPLIHKSEAANRSSQRSEWLARSNIPPRPPGRKKTIPCNGEEVTELQKNACNKLPIRNPPCVASANDAICSDNLSCGYVNDKRHGLEDASLESSSRESREHVIGPKANDSCQSSLQNIGDINKTTGCEKVATRVRLEPFPKLQRIELHSNYPEIQQATFSSSQLPWSSSPLDNDVSSLNASMLDQNENLLHRKVKHNDCAVGSIAVRRNDQISQSSSTTSKFISCALDHNSKSKSFNIVTNPIDLLHDHNHLNDSSESDVHSTSVHCPLNSCFHALPSTLPVTSYAKDDDEADNVERDTNAGDSNSRSHYNKNTSDTFALSNVNSSMTFYECPSDASTRGVSRSGDVFHISDAVTVPLKTNVYVSRMVGSGVHNLTKAEEIGYTRAVQEPTTMPHLLNSKTCASQSSDFVESQSAIAKSFKNQFLNENTNVSSDAEVKKMLDNCIEYATLIHNSLRTQSIESGRIPTFPITSNFVEHADRSSSSIQRINTESVDLHTGLGEREKTHESSIQPIVESVVTVGEQSEQADTAHQPVVTLVTSVGLTEPQKGGRTQEGDIDFSDDANIKPIVESSVYAGNKLKARSKIPVPSTIPKSTFVMPSKGISMNTIYNSAKSSIGTNVETCFLEERDGGYHITDESKRALCLHDEIRYDKREVPVICETNIYLDKGCLEKGSHGSVITPPAFPLDNFYQTRESALCENIPDILHGTVNGKDTVDVLASIGVKGIDGYSFSEGIIANEVSTYQSNDVTQLHDCENLANTDVSDKLSLTEDSVRSECSTQDTSGVMLEKIIINEVVAFPMAVCEVSDTSVTVNDSVTLVIENQLCSHSETTSDFLNEIEFNSELVNKNANSQIVDQNDVVKDLERSFVITDPVDVSLSSVQNDKLKRENTFTIEKETDASNLEDCSNHHPNLSEEIEMVSEIDSLSKTLSESSLTFIPTSENSRGLEKLNEDEIYDKKLSKSGEDEAIWSSLKKKKAKKRISRCKSEEFLPSLECKSIKHSRICDNSVSLQSFVDEKDLMGMTNDVQISYSTKSDVSHISAALSNQDSSSMKTDECHETTSSIEFIHYSMDYSNQSINTEIPLEPPMRKSSPVFGVYPSKPSCGDSSGLVDQVLNAQGQVRRDLQNNVLFLDDCEKAQFSSPRDTGNNRARSNIPRQYANPGKSRIPKKHGTTRGLHHPAPKPVRPPMWLSKAELTQEIQHLGNLCEARTKELNRLKMETRQITVGFDAFAALFKYMVEDLNALSVPKLAEDLEKTLKQLELTKQDLAYYENEVEELKAHHCQELTELSDKLFASYQTQVAELNSKHQEELHHINRDHQKQVENLSNNYNLSSGEIKAQHEKLITNLEQELTKQREELQMFHASEIKDLEERHVAGTKALQSHIEQLQKKCAELKQHSMSMEDAMKNDSDTKLQWVTSRKMDLEKEVESLKAVLEMKNKELHTIRVQNLEMDKQLEELPLARERIKMLQARAEDLEALMAAKTKAERELSSENHYIKETYERESKVNKRLSMENEELQWRLRHVEHSLMTDSLNQTATEPLEDEILCSTPMTPPPHSVSKSVFFTFVDKDDLDRNVPQSPGSQYKKISRSFSAHYKTSPAKTPIKSLSSASSPRRAKSNSEPPQPIALKATKQSVSRSRVHQKRQRCEIEVGATDPTVVTESMTSSVSSEGSVFEAKERLLEVHKDQIMVSLDILKEQQSMEEAMDAESPQEMTQSGDFTDPKTYYHMTFPVLKEPGAECDTEENSKDNSPDKEMLTDTHSREVFGHQASSPNKDLVDDSPVEKAMVETTEKAEGHIKATSSHDLASSVQDCQMDSQSRWNTM